MRKITVAAILIAIFALVITGCGKTSKNKEPVSMYVGLGNTGSEFYPKLHELILEGTGIDVKFVYNNTMDTSNAILNKLANDDAPADIIMTAAATPEWIQEQAFLDLATYTNIPDSFNPVKMKQVAVGGAIYQIPYCTRLIGVEYNKTLMDEYGWEVPKNLDEMKALKVKAEDAGVTFAVTACAATGHGFNYLFHMMGSEYLSSADGTQWFTQFRNGESGVEEFAKEAEYFREYKEAGLFGIIHHEDWDAKGEFAEKRALFYYNYINDAIGKDYVKADGTTDEYLSMPWLSSNGSSNNFTEYDCAYFALAKKLGEEDQKERLADAVTVLQFMTTEPVTKLFIDTITDGYVAVNNFEIDDTRMYREEKDNISKGYLQPWYYNSFDVDTIVNVGQTVNDYLIGTEGVEFEDIIKTLKVENDKYVNGTIDIISNAAEGLDYKAAAKLQAVSMGMAMQNAMDESGVDGLVMVAFVPYTEALTDLMLFKPLPVVQEKIYAGPIETSKVRSYVGTGYNNLECIQMTGKQIKEIVRSGFDTKTDYGHDHIFKYACMVRGEGENIDKLEDDSLYYVAVAPNSLLKSEYDALSSNVVKVGDEAVTALTEDGLMAYFDSHEDITPDNISW